MRAGSRPCAPPSPISHIPTFQPKPTRSVPTGPSLGAAAPLQSRRSTPQHPNPAQPPAVLTAPRHRLPGWGCALEHRQGRQVSRAGQGRKRGCQCNAHGGERGHSGTEGRLCQFPTSLLPQIPSCTPTPPTTASWPSRFSLQVSTSGNGSSLGVNPCSKQGGEGGSQVHPQRGAQGCRGPRCAHSHAHSPCFWEPSLQDSHSLSQKQSQPGRAADV